MVTRRLRVGNGPSPLDKEPKAKKVAPNKHATLVGLVTRHGSNLRQWSNYNDVLVEAGLLPTDVTDQDYERAVRIMIDNTVREATMGRRVRLEVLRPGDYFRAHGANGYSPRGKVLDSNFCQVKVLWDLDPKPQVQGVAPAMEVVRVPPFEFRNLYNDRVEKSSPEIPRVGDNKGEGQPEQETTMKFAEAEVRKMFIEAGIKAADKWPLKKLAEQARRVDKLHDGFGGDMGEEAKATLTNLLDCLREKTEFEVGGARVEANGAPTKKGRTHGKWKPKGEKTETKGSGKDRFGCLLGKPPAMINAVVTSREKTPEEIASEAGVDLDRVEAHFKYWAAKGKGIGLVVKKGKKGYYIPKG